MEEEKMFNDCSNVYTSSANERKVLLGWKDDRPNPGPVNGDQLKAGLQKRTFDINSVLFQEV
jgi:hypothetical protein